MKNDSIKGNDEKDISIDITRIPITSNGFRWTFTSTVLYLMLHIFSLIMPTVMILTFFSFALDSQIFHWRILLIFIDIMAWWGSYLIIS